MIGAYLCKHFLEVPNFSPVNIHNFAKLCVFDADVDLLHIICDVDLHSLEFLFELRQPELLLLQAVQQLLPLVLLLPDLLVVLFVDLPQHCSPLAFDVLLDAEVGAVHLHLLRLQLRQLPPQFGEHLLAAPHVLLGLVHHLAAQVVALDCRESLPALVEFHRAVFAIKVGTIFGLHLKFTRLLLMVHAPVHVIGELRLRVLPQHAVPPALPALPALLLEESHAAGVFGRVAGRAVGVLIESGAALEAVGDVGERVPGVLGGGLRLEQLDILHLKSSLVYNSQQTVLSSSQCLLWGMSDLLFFKLPQRRKEMEMELYIIALSNVFKLCRGLLSC